MAWSVRWGRLLFGLLIRRLFLHPLLWVHFCAPHLPLPPPAKLWFGRSGTLKFPLAPRSFLVFLGSLVGFLHRFFRPFIHPHMFSWWDRLELTRLATGSVRPIISLPSLQPWSSVANPPLPSSTGSVQPSFGDYFSSLHSRWCRGEDGRLLLHASEYFFLLLEYVRTNTSLLHRYPHISSDTIIHPVYGSSWQVRTPGMVFT